MNGYLESSELKAAIKHYNSGYEEDINDQEIDEII